MYRYVIWAVALTFVVSTSPADTGKTSQAQQVEDWIVDFMVRQVPLDQRTFYRDAQETPEDRLGRYRSIARDVIDVVYDPSTRPLFRGPDGRKRTVSVIMAVMRHESGFLRHVDYGIGKYARGDAGQSWCLMQTMTYNQGRTMAWNLTHDRPPQWGDDPEDEVFPGYTGEELVADRKACVIAGLRVLRMSFGACSDRPMLERLASYASGSCDKGLEASRSRMATAVLWYSRSVEQHEAFTDEGVMSELKPDEEKAEEDASDERVAEAD